jgi:hypothetical protein
MAITTHNKGFTIFFATLVASLALAIGLAIYDLTVRSLNLSTVASQSQYAIYAADTGAECVLYWDSHYNTNKSAFATTSAYVPAASGVVCNTQDIAAAWSVAGSASLATTTFSLTFAAQAYNAGTLAPCAKVEVGKYTETNGRVRTVVLSHGYNTCAAGAQNRLERILKVTY